jgi:hypothetical protein
MQTRPNDQWRAPVLVALWPTEAALTRSSEGCPFPTARRRLALPASSPSYPPSLVEKCRAVTSNDKDRKRAYAQVRAPLWVQAGSNGNRLRKISGFGALGPRSTAT